MLVEWSTRPWHCWRCLDRPGKEQPRPWLRGHHRELPDPNLQVLWQTLALTWCRRLGRSEDDDGSDG